MNPKSSSKKKRPAKAKPTTAKATPPLTLEDLMRLGKVVKAHFWTWTMDAKIKFVDRDAGRVTLYTREKVWVSVPMDQLVLSWGGGKLPAKPAA